MKLSHSQIHRDCFTCIMALLKPHNLFNVEIHLQKTGESHLETAIPGGDVHFLIKAKKNQSVWLFCFISRSFQAVSCKRTLNLMNSLS